MVQNAFKKMVSELESDNQKINQEYLFFGIENNTYYNDMISIDEYFKYGANTDEILYFYFILVNSECGVDIKIEECIDYLFSKIEDKPPFKKYQDSNSFKIHKIKSKKFTLYNLSFYNITEKREKAYFYMLRKRRNRPCMVLYSQYILTCEINNYVGRAIFKKEIQKNKLELSKTKSYILLITSRNRSTGIIDIKVLDRIFANNNFTKTIYFHRKKNFDYSINNEGEIGNYIHSIRSYNYISCDADYSQIDLSTAITKSSNEIFYLYFQNFGRFFQFRKLTPKEKNSKVHKKYLKYEIYEMEIGSEEDHKKKVLLRWVWLFNSNNILVFVVESDKYIDPLYVKIFKHFNLYNLISNLKVLLRVDNYGIFWISNLSYITIMYDKLFILSKYLLYESFWQFGSIKDKEKYINRILQRITEESRGVNLIHLFGKKLIKYNSIIKTYNIKKEAKNYKHQVGVVLQNGKILEKQNKYNKKTYNNKENKLEDTIVFEFRILKNDTCKFEYLVFISKGSLIDILFWSYDDKESKNLNEVKNLIY
ncbi:hypothetical protein TCON_0878 [Astathelohania contejeani]|uniref:Uncharacterized protein n=1 Tax=Astathelohania contejeani TaxID=164912 RepID=A0ABQ7I0P7_9MICR|nr:hypothetical protein TCON_0878 [Thelohania contejeani]